MDWTQVETDTEAALLPLVLGIIGCYLRRWTAALANNERLRTVRGIAFDAVQSAEEMGFLGASSEEKLEHATDSFRRWPRGFRVKLSDDQAKRLVLSALTEFRATTDVVVDEVVVPTSRGGTGRGSRTLPRPCRPPRRRRTGRGRWGTGVLACRMVRPGILMMGEGGRE